jgi:hypothetical protein
MAALVSSASRWAQRRPSSPPRIGDSPSASRQSRGRLLEAVRDLPASSLSEGFRAEAEAVLAQDANEFHTAAELYRSLEVPYEEARCLIGADELERAREILEACGLSRGPLGAALAILV